MADGKTSLLDKSDKSQSQVPSKQYLSPDMTPIDRYNLFIDCYNTPCNKVDSIQLSRIPSSKLYEFMFKLSTHICGKIFFVIFCALPFINVIPLIFSIFFGYIFWISLTIHQQNQSKINDPFKKMKFDQQTCLNMGCDYYFFTIQLKELQGFSLNYQQNSSQRLRLRKQRGKTNKMIYSSNFWGSYSYFDKWKTYHYLPFVISFTFFITINLLVILLIVL